ncbi:hypothetical protein PN36_22690 [Candidatus Thiomargarita nelsonii]|uniref:Uncharacterized protein n=1 Tax=Candidatus Thiomargarita nelsonii TaxID=1003181 RepID=A0A0A6PDG0_9GAMM|nr:hypothetical protein PN36_22690 [Candidatus Thiomargarita nelsonii]
MLNILFAGAALAYTGIKLYQSLKETKVSPLTKGILITEKVISTADLSVNPQKVEKNLSVVEESDDYGEIIRKNTERDFVISSVSLGLATVGSLVYPPFIIASIAGFAYITIPIWKKGYRSFFKERQVNMSVLDSIALPGIFITGHYLIAAVAYWLYYFFHVLETMLE